MTHFYLSILLMCLPILGQAQLFTDYESNENVDEMEITTHMFKLLSHVNIDDDDHDQKAASFYNLMKNLKAIKMLSTADQKTGKALKKDAKTLVANASLERLMHIKKENKTIDFYSKPGRCEGCVSRLLMLISDLNDTSGKLIVLSIEGDINLNAMAKVAGGMDFPGAKELKNVNTK